MTEVVLVVLAAFVLGLSIGIFLMNDVWYRHVRRSHDAIFRAWEKQINDHFRDAHGVTTRVQ